MTHVAMTTSFGAQSVGGALGASEAVPGRPLPAAPAAHLARRLPGYNAATGAAAPTRISLIQH